MNNDKFVALLKRRIQEDDNLTAAGLARAAGVDNSTIRKLLSGENRSPKVETAEKICGALGTTLQEFMGLQSDPLQEEIVALYSRLSDSERRLLLIAARGLAAESPEAN